LGDNGHGEIVVIDRGPGNEIIGRREASPSKHLRLAFKQRTHRVGELRAMICIRLSRQLILIAEIGTNHK
jgi:hypothetical protein